jgi:outer membrane protein assembly factor BamA
MVNMKFFLIIKFLLLPWFLHAIFVTEISGNPILKPSVSDQKRIKIDSVKIFKNWRTKDLIIRQELSVNPGDSVTVEQLDKAVLRIWNIGNFAKANYQLDTLENNRILLKITAQDALTIMPDFSFEGNWKEYSLSLGVNDENFLGKNIELNLAGTFGTLTKEATLRLGIPRQLLYKNMTLRVGYTYGAAQNLKYVSWKPVSVVSYYKENIFLSVGNPYHTDYHYTFSPDITIEYLSHKTDSTLFGNVDMVYPGKYHVKYLGLILNESVGLMNMIRHQRKGRIAVVTAGCHFGTDRNSPDYYQINLLGKYSVLLNKIIELDGTFSTGITNAKLPSQLIYLGPDHIKGIRNGELWGKSYISGGIKAGFTWINRNWFALEHSFFIYTGIADEKFPGLFKNKPLITTGMGLKALIPMVPWLEVSFIYAYRGKKNTWYYLE